MWQCLLDQKIDSDDFLVETFIYFAMPSTLLGKRYKKAIFGI